MIEEVLFSEEQLKKRAAELGAEISKDYEGKPILLIGILKGSLPFMADLMRRIDGDVAANAGSGFTAPVQNQAPASVDGGFMNIPDGIDEELPFN